MDGKCTFCAIFEGKAPADFVFQDETLAVIRDIRPQAPVHLLVIPRRHIRSVNDLRDEDQEIVAKLILTARDMARKQGIARSGYQLGFHVEQGGGQVIFHLHLHLMGGW